MIVWCLKENYEARTFYEKMGGEAYQPGKHKLGNRDYDIITYLYQLDGSMRITDSEPGSPDPDPAA